MTHDEYKKEHWNKLSLWGKIRDAWWTIEFAIQDWWWRVSGTCPHDGTVGPVNSKIVHCLNCQKDVPNPDFITEK